MKQIRKLSSKRRVNKNPCANFSTESYCSSETALGEPCVALRAESQRRYPLINVPSLSTSFSVRLEMSHKQFSGRAKSFMESLTTSEPANNSSGALQRLVQRDLSSYLRPVLLFLQKRSHRLVSSW